MLALAELEAQEEADTCPGCAGSLAETTAQNDRGASLHEHEVPHPTRCFRCTELAKAQEAAQSNPYPQALLWRAITNLRARR